MNVIEIELTKVKPYEKNPRKNDNAVDSVAESIKQFGFQQPIVVDKNNVIVVGHTRYKAAQKLGLKTVPCVRADDLTKEQVKAYRIADNKLNELATWDFELLGQELESFEFDFTPFDMGFPEFSAPNVINVGNTDNSGAAPIDGSPENQPATYAPSDEEERAALPEELQGIDLEPAPIQMISGDNATKLDRVIIVFPKDRQAEVESLLGLEKLSKVVYHLDELVSE